MSNYTKTTNFASKDNLSPGNPLKIVKGTEIDTEFNNIQTAVATKTDNASANITGGSITGITDLAIADGGTGASTANAALNNLLPSQASASGKYLKSNGTDSSWDALDISTADITGTLPVANGGTGVTSSTGTGSVVLSNSPTLVTPALGTPSSGVATNLTGLPLSTGVTGTLPIANGGTGQTTANAAFNALAPSQATASGKYLKSDGTNTSWDALDISTADITGTLPVANGGTGVTTSTGTGNTVLSNSPTLVTPALGTPSSATLTNATGLPISTGVSGLGTGIATALAVNVGSAGAPVVNGGALGTPSSGTATNLTGLPLSTGVTGTLPVANGGTGVTTSTGSGNNVLSTSPTLVTPILGTPTSATLTNATGLPLSTGVTGTLPVANGGTGQTSYTDGQLLIGNSTGNTLTKATLTAGSGISVTNAGGSITIAATGGGGTGDVVGPSSATANGIALFNSTTGKLIKDSAASDGLIYGLTVGRGAGAVSTNTAVGASALAANTSGTNNAAFGTSALAANTSALYGTAIGAYALASNTTATHNTAVGYLAGYSTTTGGGNVAIGYAALYGGTAVTNTTAVGYAALSANTTGTDNTAVGRQTLQANTSGYSNSAFGIYALYSNTTAINNTAVGREALYSNTTASNNVALGYQALYANTTGYSNVAVGSAALRAVTTGAANVAVGTDALLSNTADSNTAVGHYAMRGTTSGSSNVAFGQQALYSNTTGGGNVAVGYHACYSGNGAYLTGVGIGALESCTGAGNTAVGAYTLYALTTGTGNIAMGGYDNTASPPAGRYVTTGTYNVFLGQSTGCGGTPTTTGSYIINIGAFAYPSSSSVTNELVIGEGTGKGYSTGFITFGGGIYQGNNSSSWSTTSDQRLKKNIVNNDVGLEKLTQIQVRNFEYRTEDEVTELPKEQAIQKQGVQLGVIAQELQQILPECVKTESTGVMTVDTDNLTWYLINAVKQLKAEIDQLKGN